MIEQLADRGGPAQPLLIARGLHKYFPVKGRTLGPKLWVRAVDGVDLDVIKGETLAVVGESGCGKSTISRLIMSLMLPTRGEIIFDGEKLGSWALSLKDYRRQVQMVFQDSYASLNPRLPIEETIAFGPIVHGMARRDAVNRAHELLEAVGMSPSLFARRYPHQLSGGQRQRVNIARALALRPRLLILDEPVSALDKSVEAQVLNLLVDLKERYALTYVFISHDLNVIQYVADRVAVMYLGRIVEVGTAADVFEAPRHPYTRALLASRPSMDPDRRLEAPPVTGDPPNPINPPSGCRFRTRCSQALASCAATMPELMDAPTPDHRAACLRLDETIQLAGAA
jgi:peptide/nickel transport system ATP-binding protein